MKEHTERQRALLKKEAIAIVDFGSQYVHLIANRIRRQGVYAEIMLPTVSLERLKKYKGVILSGGPNSVYQRGAPQMSKRLFALGIPVLGICYGHHLMMKLLGGKVRSAEIKEYGLAKLTVQRRGGLFENVKKTSQAWMSHGDEVSALPKGFDVFAKTEDCPFAATGDTKRNLYSIQFHAEVAHTEEGMQIIKNFVAKCDVKKSWNMERFLQEKMDEVKQQIGDRNVFMLVSGGVDSTVAHALLTKALGPKRVYGLLVDTGLMRKDECKKITAALKKIGVTNLHVEDASRQFFSALKGECDPERKRKIIGDMFLTVQAKVSHRLKLNPDEWVLGQGTIYPDTIESAGTKHADKIKTHHNRVPEILELIKKGRVVEPIAELYKDEVRTLGTKLGLPDSLIWRHPFPGPGLGVRILCAKEPHLPNMVNTLHSWLAKHLVAHKLHQAVLPLRSVGVQGDARTYRNPLVVWGAEHSFTKLEWISTALTNSFSEINRVTLLLAPQRFESVKVLPASITKERVALLQKLDDIVMQFIREEKISRKIWQFPTVLVPLRFNGSKKEAVVLRPVCSDEAMTANFYKMNRDLLKKLTAKLAPHVSAVLYDITNKPPGTIEWE
ncbi:glutamine-hydrolyzing GMP synthase [Candidatus Peregrinibacteria bacterium CG11_big_fil_rev_8_21_14_0_20_46_8]|nr:MAG: glutamine-hydrolyzing GMP synthase [Candidatus Peregrinibacteria bacterium CG11_big_fil_rev_8_21_14_0_20_46_8]